MKYAPLVVVAALLATFALSVEYDDAYTRSPNITINYSKIPWVLRGITPRLQNPAQAQYDAIVPVPTPPRLDPRSCQGEIALCYQVLQHNFTGVLTYGSNYTHASGYVLPERRVKMFVCIGNDTACVGEATGCFCPEQNPPKATPFLGGQSRCTDTQHLCRNSYATFTLCTGNVSSCEEHNLECGCGRYATCTGTRFNVCLTGRNELYACKGSLSDCLTTYDTCFCGDEALTYQRGCAARRHVCSDGNSTMVCVGSFTECALLHERCACGTG